MKKYIPFLLLSCVICVSVAYAADNSKPVYDESYQFNYPPAGVIPNQQTAIEVGEAILKPVYGAEKIKKEEPFTAKLSGDTWTVTGHFNYPPGTLAGVAEIHLSKSKGTVILISHGM